MDPKWSNSSLVRFDLPNQKNGDFHFGCDLSFRNYDYERIWIIIDTTDNLPTDKFRCPIPYIDTSIGFANCGAKNCAALGS